MNFFFEEHQQILGLLHKYEVKYLLIGGYAVNFYGYHRTTGDMDLWLASDKDNIAKFRQVLLAFGIDQEDLRKIKKLDFNKPQVFSIGEEPTKIDFLTKVNLLDFYESYKSCQKYKLDNVTPIFIIQYHDLILSKINTGRTQDAADIEELQKKNRNKTRE